MDHSESINMEPSLGWEQDAAASSARLNATVIDDPEDDSTELECTGDADSDSDSDMVPADDALFARSELMRHSLVAGLQPRLHAALALVDKAAQKKPLQQNRICAEAYSAVIGHHNASAGPDEKVEFVDLEREPEAAAAAGRLAVAFMMSDSSPRPAQRPKRFGDPLVYDDRSDDELSPLERECIPWVGDGVDPDRRKRPRINHKPSKEEQQAPGLSERERKRRQPLPPNRTLAVIDDDGSIKFYKIEDNKLDLTSEPIVFVPPADDAASDLSAEV